MRRLDSFQDDRLRTDVCAYCNRPSSTKDHVPSKVMLDEPYPERLLTVRSCLECNNEVSMAEEYFACAIECAQVGSAQPSELKRGKIKVAISNNKQLFNEMESSFVYVDGRKYFRFDKPKFDAVVVKLCKGHLRWELDEYITHEPEIWYGALIEMTEDERYRFRIDPEDGFFSEVGSRACQKQIELGITGWMTIQEGTYEYCFSQGPPVEVRIFIRGWFAIWAVWSDY